MLGVHGLVHGDAGPPLHVLHLKLRKTGPAVIVIRLDDGQGGQGGVLQVAGEPWHRGGGRAGTRLLYGHRVPPVSKNRTYHFSIEIDL